MVAATDLTAPPLAGDGRAPPRSRSTSRSSAAGRSGLAAAAEARTCRQDGPRPRRGRRRRGRRDLRRADDRRPDASRHAPRPSRRDRRRDRRRRDPPGLPGQPARGHRDGAGRREARGRRRRPGPGRSGTAGRVPSTTVPASRRSRATDGPRPGGRHRGPGTGGETTTPADTVVVGLGLAPRDLLARMAGAVPVTVVGDAADRPAAPARPDRGRRLRLHGHDRRRPRGRLGRAATPSSSSSSARARPASARARAARACRTSARGSPPGPARCPIRSPPARRPARSRWPRPRPRPTSTPSGRTPLHDEHLAAGARMDRFGGWWRPWNYGDAVVGVLGGPRGRLDRRRARRSASWSSRGRTSSSSSSASTRATSRTSSPAARATRCCSTSAATSWTTG